MYTPFVIIDIEVFDKRTALITVSYSSETQLVGRDILLYLKAYYYKTVQQKSR